MVGKSTGLLDKMEWYFELEADQQDCLLKRAQALSKNVEVIEGDDERKNGRKMLNNLTPKRFKRVYDLMVQVTNEPRVPSPGTPSTSTSGAATPSKCKKALFNSQEKPK